MSADRQQEALRAMAAEEPELAARLLLATIPAAAARIPGPLAFEVEVPGVGARRIRVADGSARSEPAGGAEAVDFRIVADASTLVRLAGGGGVLGPMLTGRLRIQGSRRRARALRAMGAGKPPTLGDAVRQGEEVEPGVVYRALRYLIDPEWTRGHRFVVRYVVEDAPDGTWHVAVDDGAPVRVTREEPSGGAGTTVRTTSATFRDLIARRISPASAIRLRRVVVDGEMHPATLLGRWTERAQGRDGAEIERERVQREVLERRGTVWGGANGRGFTARVPDAAAAAAETEGQGDPGHEREAGRRDGVGLMTYEELYALWERQNWRVHELDFSVDREQWLTTPREGQENTEWSLGLFYVGEERVTADLAPFVLAAPSGEAEVFLSTQLVDEARHAAFFDRFAAEVMALGADDLRGRLAELEARMLAPWHEVFDDGLREVADRLKRRPDDLDVFVEAVTTYHMIVEGLLAVTGQRYIRGYMEDHGLYPGFCTGFALVERDEHRHIAFGVRFLKDAMAQDAARFRPIVERRVRELVPKAVGVFVPPYAESAERFVSYGYDSTQIYGYAYRALKRRLAVIGLECPPPDELMPGPIAEGEAVQAVGAAA